MNENQPAYITVGVVLGLHGLEGELSVKVLTEFPERFNRGARLYIEGKPYTVESASLHKEMALLKLRGLDTPQAAGMLRGKSVEIPEGEVKELPEGRYYHHDIIGLEVWTTAGTFVGTVSDILSTGCNDVYVVSAECKEALIPAVKDVVKEINVSKKRITIEAIEGLLG